VETAAPPPPSPLPSKPLRTRSSVHANTVGPPIATAARTTKLRKNRASCTGSRKRVRSTSAAAAPKRTVVPQSRTNLDKFACTGSAGPSARVATSVSSHSATETSNSLDAVVIRLPKVDTGPLARGGGSNWVSAALELVMPSTAAGAPPAADITRTEPRRADSGVAAASDLHPFSRYR
jgi:hypothetical protein